MVRLSASRPTSNETNWPALNAIAGGSFRRNSISRTSCVRSRMRSTWARKSCSGIPLVYRMPSRGASAAGLEREVADLAEGGEGFLEIVVFADRQDDHAIRMQVLPRDAQQVILGELHDAVSEALQEVLGQPVVLERHESSDDQAGVGERKDERVEERVLRGLKLVIQH